MKKKDYTVTIMVVVGLFLLTMMLVVVIAPERQELQPIVKMMHKQKSAAQMQYNGRAHVEAIDQSVKGKVVLLSVAFKQNGYVVIHKEEKGKPGKIIGVSRMLMPGIYANAAITLNENVVPGEVLYAMLHTDNGDGIFSVDTDVPVKGDEMMVMGGSPMVRFMAL